MHSIGRMEFKGRASSEGTTKTWSNKTYFQLNLLYARIRASLLAVSSHVTIFNQLGISNSNVAQITLTIADIFVRYEFITNENSPNVL